MNYVHPSLITPGHMHRYVVFCADGLPQVVRWRKDMGGPSPKGAYCTERKMKRTTEFVVVNDVLLVGELPIPTREQIDAAAEVHSKLVTA